ncbi:SIS domain-containing protein, partial [bacterium]|nr:SIS domain-containing protein [bacterium]
KLQGDYADLIKNIKHAIKNLESITELSELKKRSIMFFDSIEVSTLKTIAEKNNMCAENDYTLESSFSGFLFELRKQVSDNKIDPVIKLIDAIFLLEESSDINTRINQFVDKMVQSYEYGSSIYLIACGTSYHAAKTASIFFDKIPGLNIYPLLPGEFRSQYANSIRNRDVLIGISQSGETKDLIDIFNQVEKNSKEVTLISIVNNVNSSLALEKSELFIPLRCGPEISVPATKSFLNQLIVMYILALRLANRFIKLGIKKLCQKKLDGFWENLYKIPDLIKRTISGSDESINIIAQNLFMEPSMHILATGMLGIAKEGALKIREVVLNHTEGFEGAEFKHGPNTILGVNSIFGLDAIKSVMGKLAEGMDDALNTEEGKRLDGKGVLELFKALYNYSFHKKSFTDLDSDMKTLVKKVNEGSHLFDSLYTNYPLIFVTNSSDRDINLTISQINTHKIRGANVFIIAEKNNLLYDAISKVPESKYEVRYKFGYIELPETGDELLPAFTSTVVLQLLALKMSVLKRQLLNKLGIIDHGVHPDSPKNVSKSITVD